VPSYLELACEICTEEFRVPESLYATWGTAVGCPCCGSTELIVLGVTEPAALRATA